MVLVVYSQYCRTRHPEQHLVVDKCLRRNLNHPGTSRMVLFCQSDAPPVPDGTVPVEVVTSDERISYPKWFRWVKRQGARTRLFLNTGVYLDERLEQLATGLDEPEALHTVYYPHMSHEVRGEQADGDLPERQLYSGGLPLGLSGCDKPSGNAMTSYEVRVQSVHVQTNATRHHFETGDRLYERVTNVHSRLAPDEGGEPEISLWRHRPQQTIKPGAQRGSTESVRGLSRAKK